MSTVGEFAARRAVAFSRVAETRRHRACAGGVWLARRAPRHGWHACREREILERPARNTGSRKSKGESRPMSFVKRIERVALAVEDLDQARRYFEKCFGAQFAPIEQIEDMGIR